MRFSILFLLFLACVGCVTRRAPEVPEYRLRRVGHFLVSESPALWSFFRNEKMKDGKFDIEFFIRNDSSAPQQIDLSKAKLNVNEDVQPVSCLAMSVGDEILKIAAGEQSRVRCEAVLRPSSANHLDQKDTIVVMMIPLEKDSIHIERLVRIEEVQP